MNGGDDKEKKSLFDKLDLDCSVSRDPLVCIRFMVSHEPMHSTLRERLDNLDTEDLYVLDGFMPRNPLLCNDWIRFMVTYEPMHPVLQQRLGWEGISKKCFKQRLAMGKYFCCCCGKSKQKNSCCTLFKEKLGFFCVLCAIEWELVMDWKEAQKTLGSSTRGCTALRDNLKCQEFRKNMYYRTDDVLCLKKELEKEVPGCASTSHPAQKRKRETELPHKITELPEKTKRRVNGGN